MKDFLWLLGTILREEPIYPVIYAIQEKARQRRVANTALRQAYADLKNAEGGSK